MNKDEKKKYCRGCYNNVYNAGLGGAKECWSLQSSELIWRKRIHINQAPPFDQDAEKLPDCYVVPKYVFLNGKNRTGW